MKLHINDLILYRGNDELNLGVAGAFLHHEIGLPTRSEHMPVIVKYLPEEKKYIVLDGYHRIVKGLLEGKRVFDCTFEGADEHKYWIPPRQQRYTLTESKLRKIIRKTLIRIL